MIDMETCPGNYCGRIQYDNLTLSDCGACPFGYRSSNIFINKSNSICVKCTDNLELYDYLFLIFIFLSQLTFEFYIIDKCIKRSILTFETVILYVCSFFEIVFSVILSFFIYAYDYPNYKITTCKSFSLLDWYPVFEDPVFKGKQLRCSREIVYPLYSWPFCYLFFTFVFLITMRSFVISKFKNKVVNGSLTIYLTMYLIPIIGLINFLFAGVIYYFWPYILLVCSIISITIHFAYKLDQKCSSLIREVISNKRSTTIVIMHWILHSIALIALIETKKLSYFLLLFTPVPSIFYILTSKFTQPSRFL